MFYRFSIALVAFAFAATPAFAQDCANIPTSAEAVDEAYADCMTPGIPDVRVDPTDQAFAMRNTLSEFVTFTQNDPATLNSCGPYASPDFMNAGDHEGDDFSVWYGLNGTSAVSVDKSGGCGVTDLGALVPSNGGTWTGCTYDYVDDTFYCIAADACGVATSLYEVDFSPLTATLIGTDATNLLCGIAIASDNAGTLYAYGVVNDQLVTISKADGSSTVVGPMPFDANFGQGMDADNFDGTMYACAFNNTAFNGEWWIIDTADPAGGSSLVGTLGNGVDLEQLATCSSQTPKIPVELVSFNATTNGMDVDLTWTTASETNNAGFEVQVQNGESWNALGFVEGHGTTTEAQTYNYSADMGVGTHTFRLKQIDFDGAFEYSDELEVSVETPGSHVLTSAYPNPFNPQSQFTLAVAQDQVVTAELYNSLGQRVATLFSGTVEANQAQQITIDGAGLASGMYVVRVDGESFSDALSVTLLK